MIKWSISNSIKQIKDDSLYWANQGFSFEQKECAKSHFKKQLQNDLSAYYDNCKEDYSVKLEDLYKNSRDEILVKDLVCRKFRTLKNKLKKFLINDNFDCNTINRKNESSRSRY